jgi:hypothetical protein
MKEEVSRTDETSIIYHDPVFAITYSRNLHSTIRSLHCREQFTRCAVCLEMVSAEILPELVCYTWTQYSRVWTININLYCHLTHFI